MVGAGRGAMAKMNTVILSAISDGKLLRNLRPLLKSSSFEIHPAQDARAALVLTRNLKYDLILVGHPLPDLAIAEFLTAVHDSESSCADTPVLILAEADRLSEVQRFAVGGRVRAAAASRTDRELARSVASLLGIAERVASRLMVQVSANLGEGKVSRLCQTRNISETGMLLRTSRLLPVGARLGLELVLPGDPRPIHAEAEVVRHSRLEIERLPGIGVRFLRFDADGGARLREHVYRSISGG